MTFPMKPIVVLFSPVGAARLLASSLQISGGGVWGVGGGWGCVSVGPSLAGILVCRGVVACALQGGGHLGGWVWVTPWSYWLCGVQSHGPLCLLCWSWAWFLSSCCLFLLLKVQALCPGVYRWVGLVGERCVCVGSGVSANVCGVYLLPSC